MAPAAGRADSEERTLRRNRPLARRARAMAVRSVVPALLSLALAFPASSPAGAQGDSPEATVQAFVAAVTAGDLEALPALFCEEHAVDLGGFGLDALAVGLPGGLEPATVIEALSLSLVGGIETISQSQSEAFVHLDAILDIGLDEVELTSLIVSMLAGAGQEVSEEDVASLAAQVAAGFAAEQVRIEQDVRLVPGDGGWLICVAIGDGGVSDGAGPGAGADGQEGEGTASG